MRSNAVKSCAVGAMLFGGALSMTQTASAGLTWLGSHNDWNSANQSFLYYGFFQSETVAASVGTASLSALTGSVSRDGFVGSVNYSATTGPGFSVSLSANGGPGRFQVMGARVFTVTGTESVSITYTRPQQYGLFTLDRVTDPGQQDSILYVTQSGVVNADLTAGTYRLMWVVDAEGQAFSGQVFSFVPAPGALALLGAAGLVSGRRRRA